MRGVIGDNAAGRIQRERELANAAAGVVDRDQFLIKRGRFGRVAKVETIVGRVEPEGCFSAGVAQPANAKKAKRACGGVASQRKRAAANNGVLNREGARGGRALGGISCFEPNLVDLCDGPSPLNQKSRDANLICT